jgi:hypothetical protein
MAALVHHVTERPVSNLEAWWAGIQLGIPDPVVHVIVRAADCRGADELHRQYRHLLKHALGI